MILRTYHALLTQTGSAAPVASYVHNNLGFEVSFEYVGEGVYQTAQTFPVGTLVFENFALFGGYGASVFHDLDSGKIRIHTFTVGVNEDGVTAASTDGLINMKPISILVPGPNAIDLKAR